MGLRSHWTRHELLHLQLITHNKRLLFYNVSFRIHWRTSCCRSFTHPFASLMRSDCERWPPPSVFLSVDRKVIDPSFSVAVRAVFVLKVIVNSVEDTVVTLATEVSSTGSTVFRNSVRSLLASASLTLSHVTCHMSHVKGLRRRVDMAGPVAAAAPKKLVSTILGYCIIVVGTSLLFMQA